MFRKLLGAIFGLAIMSMAATANASLIWEFDFGTEVESSSGAGTIEFSGPSSADGDTILSFSFSGIIGGTAVTYDESDIITVGFPANWSINEDWEFDSLFIQTFVDVDGLSNFVHIVPTFITLACTDTVSPGSRCVGGGGAFLDGYVLVRHAIGSDGAFLEPVHIPEPATLGLFAIGLVGLGVMTRRRRKQDLAA